MIYKTMQAFISFQYHTDSILWLRQFKQFFINNSPTSISEEQESLTSTASSSKQDKRKKRELTSKQTVVKNTQQDISETKEYSDEKAERVSLQHK